MGSTYYITGVQIGMIFAMMDFDKIENVRDILQTILDKQETTKETRKR